jgi:hypothetical protein
MQVLYYFTTLLALAIFVTESQVNAPAGLDCDSLIYAPHVAEITGKPPCQFLIVEIESP